MKRQWKTMELECKFHSDCHITTIPEDAIQIGKGTNYHKTFRFEDGTLHMLGPKKRYEYQHSSRHQNHPHPECRKCQQEAAIQETNDMIAGEELKEIGYGN
jgi:hypothetical protein